MADCPGLRVSAYTASTAALGTCTSANQDVTLRDSVVSVSGARQKSSKTVLAEIRIQLELRLALCTSRLVAPSGNRACFVTIRHALRDETARDIQPEPRPAIEVLHGVLPSNPARAQRAAQAQRPFDFMSEQALSVCTKECSDLVARRLSRMCQISDLTRGRSLQWRSAMRFPAPPVFQISG